MIIKILFLATTLCLSIHAFAMKPFLSYGLGIGQTRFPDLSGNGTTHPQSGSNWFIKGGVVAALSPTWPHRFETQFSIGFLKEDFRATDDSDQKVTWTHIPVEALYYYHNTQELFRVGWGYTIRLFNDFSTKGPTRNRSIGIEDTGGWTFAAEKLYQSYDSESARFHETELPSTEKKRLFTYAIGIIHHRYDFKDSRHPNRINGSSTLLTWTVLDLEQRK